jgi:tyrosyl-tRNA synthetase
MWRYYELLTDLSVDEIAGIRRSAESGERNPRDLKVELAKRIITDFHSSTDAQAAEDEFNRVFKRKEVPDEIEERIIEAGIYKLTLLLAETALASSVGEARRLIEQGGVRIDGERRDRANIEIKLDVDATILIQVGKRRFLRARGA